MAAARAKSFAVFAAESSCREGQKHLLPKNVFEQKTTLLIIPDFGLIGGDGTLGGTAVDTEGAEDEVEAALKGAANRFKAAGAGDLKVARPGGLQADVFNDLAMAAMLGNEVGASRNGEGRGLGKFETVVDGAGLEGKVLKDEGLALKVENGDQHDEASVWGILLSG